MSLRDGAKKMSKSDESDYSRINLTDGADAIAQKIRKARTDPDPLPESDKGFEGRPEAENLVNIYAALSDVSLADVLREFGGRQFSEFKGKLADLAVARLTPIAAEMRRLLTDPAEIDAILAAGAEKARTMAGPIVAQVKQVIGFVA
jgi:tryptophanyl-tRNA synthetase